MFAGIAVKSCLQEYCLMDKFVNQHNPWALLIMSLAGATSYFIKALSWQPLLFQMV
jgi:hypothetical protein